MLIVKSMPGPCGLVEPEDGLVDEPPQAEAKTSAHIEVTIRNRRAVPAPLTMPFLPQQSRCQT
jgi:hypothetical protein